MQDLFRYGIDENGQIRSEKTHKFKDSPLGRIPEEWEVGSFSNMAIINPNKVKINDPNFLVTFLGMEDISEQGKILQRHECYYSLVGIGYTSFIENDILFAKITPCMENGKGAYAKGLKNGVGFGSTEFHVLRAKGGSSPLFIYQYLLTQNLRLQARNNMTGTAGQQRVPSSFFYSYLILIPSINEQSRISSVLSSADEAIEKEQAYKEKLLALKRGLFLKIYSRRFLRLNQARNLTKRQVYDILKYRL
ncbi:MAG: restriction endonuclease subunit S [Candidatus Brocadiae bacterium]|nr:restriction endonuclease subunit S [Candidatus Brocadiia bacterium]